MFHNLAAPFHPAFHNHSMASLTISSSDAIDAALDDELGGSLAVELAGGMGCALCLCRGSSQIVGSPAQGKYNV